MRNKIDPDTYAPAYGGESVGLDLYNASNKRFSHHGHHHVDRSPTENAQLIPTGLKVALPPHVGGFIFQRGSITRSGFVARAGVVDPGYTGEIFVNLANITRNGQSIEPHQKLPVQLVLLPTLTHSMQFVSSEDYELATTGVKRGAGKVGSSDAPQAAEEPAEAPVEKPRKKKTSSSET